MLPRLPVDFVDNAEMAESKRVKLIRVTTVPVSLRVLLTGQMRFMSEAGLEVVMVSSDGPDVEKLLATECCEHVIVPMTREVTPFQDLKGLFRLWRFFLRERPDIVHSHTPKAGLLAMIAGRFAGVPICIHTVAGIPALSRTGLSRSILLAIESLTYRFAHRVYPNSKELMKIMRQENLCNESRMSVIGHGSSNGIDSAFFNRTEEISQEARDLRLRHGIPFDAKLLCFVGRIVADKGINELVGAFSRIVATKPSTYLMLVGSFESELDPLSERTSHLISTDARIVRVGFQQDVRPFMAASDIFVFPSYREGFPNVVMQAACMDVPVIASDINGCNEIIIDGENGFLVTPKNERMLQEAIDRLLDDETLRDRFAKSARKSVVERYERTFVQGEILKEYKRLLSNLNLSFGDA
jgi:glycosyltransferase involved in cell wall biosynthesis